MNWTTPDHLKKQVQKLWEKGTILSSMATGEPLFPLKLAFKRPTSRELSDNFDDVRKWISLLVEKQGAYRIEWKTVEHRILGCNSIPWEIWIDSLEDGLEMIGRGKEGKSFASLLALTGEREPSVLPWLARKPLQGLNLCGHWTAILDVVAWLKDNPKPSIYLRQIDLPGIHSKFIETHRLDLGEILDLALPEESIDRRYNGKKGFCGRYGFKEKPLRVRFRILDQQLNLPYGGEDQDITVTDKAFASLNLNVARVFVVENEINFLAFPQFPGAMAIFGSGYGFGNLSQAHWLKSREVHYWGDLDTHGFAILNQFRSVVPNCGSLLMDEKTLLEHRDLWGEEITPERGDLTMLTDEEQSLYRQLNSNVWGKSIRLEQERIGFNHLREALDRLKQKKGAQHRQYFD